ncbi:MAG: PHD finger protein 14, partial [Marteilia pararefringens]
SDPNKLNEIVICDVCGISVHEVCYGIIDDGTSIIDPLREESGETNAQQPGADVEPASLEDNHSIEYWFCDECKAAKKPRFATQAPQYCELCPDLGFGPKKETETHGWIHMVCALYTPTVQFHISDTLTSATLSKLDASHWGKRPCNLCTEETLKYTGYTVKCHHMHCKRYFHPTCSQNAGLIFSSLDSKLPYYVLCLNHAHSQGLQTTVEENKSRVDILKQMFNKDLLMQRLTSILTTNPGLLNELQKHSQVYTQLRSKWPDAWEKKVMPHRPIHSSSKLSDLFSLKIHHSACLRAELDTDEQIGRETGQLDTDFAPDKLRELLFELRDKLPKKLDKIEQLNNKSLDIVHRIHKARSLQESLREQISRTVAENIKLGYLKEIAQGLIKSPELLKPNSSECSTCEICRNRSVSMLMTECHCQRQHHYHPSCLKQEGILPSNIVCSAIN